MSRPNCRLTGSGQGLGRPEHGLSRFRALQGRCKGKAKTLQGHGKGTPVIACGNTASWRCLRKTVLVTFTWPDNLPQNAVEGISSGQVDTNSFHLAGKISKICLGSTCGGWYPGQVNVTGIANNEIQNDGLPDAGRCTDCG